MKEALVYEAIIENVKNNIKKEEPKITTTYGEVNIKKEEPKITTTYGKVADRVQQYLGLSHNRSSHGADYFIHWNKELAEVLGRISKKCLEQNLAPITILVENEQEGVSGEGFIAYQEEIRNKNFKEAWIRLVKNTTTFTDPDNKTSGVVSEDFKKIVDFIQEIVAISYGLK